MKKYKRITALILTVSMIAAMFAFSSMTVSAEALTANMGDDSYTATYNATDEIIEFNGDNLPKGDLLYSLKFDSNKAGKANWFPVFGSAVNVSKYIPSKSGKTYVIGFILLDDFKNNELSKAQSLAIPARVAAPAKGQNKYDPKTGFTLVDGAEVRFELGEWVDKATIESNKDHFTIAENFPFGAKGEIRIAANPDDNKAASSSIKFKIPAQPKTPKISVAKVGEETVKDSNGADKEVDVMGLKGAKSTMEISSSPNFTTGEVIDATDKIKVADLKSKLFTGTNESKIIDKKADVYVRIKATDRKPYSMAAKVTVDFSSLPADSPPAES